MRVAVVATVRNEEADILRFVKAIEYQSRKPDLVVITVAPSTDQTQMILDKWASLTFLKTQIIKMWSPYMAPAIGLGPNRSVGRNLGIQTAIRNDVEIVALTNVCEPDRMWLETLVKPIEDGVANMTGGSWVIDAHNDREEALGLLTQFSQDQMDATKISALNMAITAEAFMHVGGFDEDLDTSEDTEFVQAANALMVKMAFEPGAVVKWRPSTLTLRGATKTYYQFAVTDAKAYILSDQYIVTYLTYFIFPLIPFWLMYRIRKVLKARLWRQIPYALATAFAMDVARMVGYARGRISRS